MTRWHANVAFRTTGLFTHDTAFDVLEAMSQYAAAVAPYTSNDVNPPTSHTQWPLPHTVR